MCTHRCKRIHRYVHTCAHTAAPCLTSYGAPKMVSIPEAFPGTRILLDPPQWPLGSLFPAVSHLSPWSLPAARVWRKCSGGSLEMRYGSGSSSFVFPLGPVAPQPFLGQFTMKSAFSYFPPTSSDPVCSLAGSPDFAAFRIQENSMLRFPSPCCNGF